MLTVTEPNALSAAPTREPGVGLFMVTILLIIPR
jgi:hypothetical protein